MKRLKTLLIPLIVGVIMLLAVACTQTGAPAAGEPEAPAATLPDTESPTSEPDTPTEPAASEPKRGGVLNVVFTDWPKNLHPQIDSGTEGVYVQANIYDSLVNIDVNGNIVPGLATDLPEQPDDVTYIFHLREGVKFHNGTDFDAEDVLWTFDRLLGKIEGQQSAQAPRYQAAIESIEAPDPYTIIITLTKPWDDFIHLMAADKYMDILSEEAFAELGEEYGLEGAVGTGPFKFEEWERGSHIKLVRNEDYWGEPAYLDEIIYRAIPEETTRSINIMTGETDLLLHPSFKDVASMVDDPNFKVQMCDSGTMIPFFLNTTQPPFDDKTVRQAIFYGIDRQAIMDSVYHGWVAKGQGIFPPWHWAYDPEADFYPYDPDMARQLLAEAGYTEDNPLEFTITSTNATEYIDIATLIQAQLAEVGVNVVVDSMDAAAWTAKTWPVEGAANPGYQAAIFRFRFSNPTTDFSWRIYHSQTALNLFGYNQPGGYQRPEMDSMLDDAWVITDREEAIEAYQEISSTITDDALLLVLGWLKTVNIAQPYVEGLGCWVREDTPMQGLWLNQ